MPEPPLLVLCTQADLADQVLRRLPLRALACLGATCRGLRALLDEQPQALWQAAAAAAGYADTHPVRCACDVSSWLRQQHATHQNLASGRWRTRHLDLPAGATAPDCRKHLVVKFGFCNLAHIVELPSGDVPHTWTLPELTYTSVPPASYWDGSSNTIVLPFGRAWAAPGLPRDYSAGLVFVSASSGYRKMVQLPSQQERVQEDASARVHGWSAASLLLVEHDSDAGQDCFSVFGLTGQLVACCMPEHEGAREIWEARWDLAGETVAPFCADQPKFWVWKVRSAAASSLQCIEDPEEVMAMTWGPQGLLLYPTASALVILDPLHGSFHVQEVKATRSVFWGHVGIVLVSDLSKGASARWYVTVEVYQVCNARLVLTRSLSLSCKAQSAQVCPKLSPDGCHLLLGEKNFTAEDGDLPSLYRLQVLNLVTGKVQQLRSEALPSLGRSARWCSQGTHVLLEDTSSGPSVIMDFS